MLLSLWKIDDAVTFLFMDQFYSTLFTQNDMLKAYQSALKKIMEEYPEYTGGIGSACKQENDISGYKKEIISMLDYSLRASKGYFEDLILIVKIIHSIF